MPSEVPSLRIAESGAVPILEVTNPEDRAVLLIANLVLSGGLQTRTVERSVVVPPRSSLGVPVRCVEAGRSGPPARGQDEAFRVAGRTSLSMRGELHRHKLASLRSGSGWRTDQARVWDSVEAELEAHGARSATRSYKAYLETTQTLARARVQSSLVRPPAGANAVLLAARGALWLEAFPTEHALSEQTESLLSDLCVERPAAPPGRPRERNPHEALRALWTLPLCALDPVQGSLGDAFALSGDAAGGELLLVGGRIAHLSIAAWA